MDGEEGPAYDGIGNGSLVFSPDGKHMAYVAGKGEKQLVVWDGKEGPLYDLIYKGAPVFSPDGRRVAYAASKGDKQVVVVDGEEGPAYEGIADGSLVFSPDGKHVVYAAHKGDHWLAISDGKEGPAYNGIGTPIFSPDGQRVAYAAGKGQDWLVVVDGEEGPTYDGIGNGSLVFSPDGKRLAYAAMKGGNQVVVVDGEEGPAYDGIIERTLVFSPDGQRAVYAAKSGEECLVVLAGKEGPAYDGIADGSLVFGPDGRRVAYRAWKGDKQVVVVDGEEGPAFHGVVRNGPTFREGGMLEYLATNDKGLLRVQHLPAADGTTDHITNISADTSFGMVGLYWFGVEFPFMPDWSAFSGARASGEPAALVTKFGEIWPLWRSAKEADPDFTLPQYDVVCLNPKCFHELPVATHLCLPDPGNADKEWMANNIFSWDVTKDQLLQTAEGKCPFCGEEVAVLLCDNLRSEQVEHADADRLRHLCREHLVWSRETLRIVAPECERCGREIDPHRGYIVGHAYCEQCGDEHFSDALSHIRQDPHYFGHGTVRRARRLSAGRWNQRVPCGGVFHRGGLRVRITFPRSFRIGGLAESAQKVRRIFIFRNAPLERSRGQDLYDAWLAAIPYIASNLSVNSTAPVSFRAVDGLRPAPDGRMPLDGGDWYGLQGCGTQEPFVYMLMRETAEDSESPSFCDRGLYWFFFADNFGGHGLIYALLEN